MNERSHEERLYGSLELIADCVEDDVGVGDCYFGGGSHHCLRYVGTMLRTYFF